jgi:hypothetical protein
MERRIPAIPTKYKGVQFRSRLEARWAAFFDLAGWRWDYEPLDLDGWIPDFVLYGQKRRLFIEVKPIDWKYNANTTLDITMPKIERALLLLEKKTAAVIVGSTLCGNDGLGKHIGQLACIGIMCIPRAGWCMAPLALETCGDERCDILCTPNSYLNGVQDSKMWAIPEGHIWTLRWTEAGNIVQWKGPTNA